MFNFFFDTADIEYIRKVWEKVSQYFTPQNIVGITTNPNAMDKEGLTTLESWEQHLPKLCALVTELRGDGQGVVYVQMPNSRMSADDALAWAKHISQFTDGSSQLGLKIPPLPEILNIVPQLNEIMQTNVTGVSDAATALSCFSFGPRYVSIIPGRMAEVGIVPEDHLLLAQQRSTQQPISEIISGSMRTLEGLSLTVRAKTVPTIGCRVWDSIIENPEVLETVDWVSPLRRIFPIEVVVDERNHNLSRDFFIQMDDLGQSVYEDWRGRLNKLKTK